MKNSLKIYEPDNSIKKGFFSVFGDITKELVENRWLTYQLFKRDFFALYKQSFVGVLWVFIIPIFSVGTFIILNRSGVFHIGEISTPYPIFAVLGVAFWQLFSSGLIASTSSLSEAGQMIKIINFSRKSLVIAATGRALVSFGIQLIVAGFLCIYYKRMPHSGILWTPFLILPLLLLTLGFGFIFSLLNGIMRDVGNTLGLLMTFLMFLTPILYAKPHSGLLEKITRWNPVYYLVDSPRTMILQGSMPEWKGFLYSSIFSLVLFVFCLVIFHLTETRIAERV